MEKKKREKIFDTVKKIPIVNKIPGLNYVLNAATTIGTAIDQFNSKKDKIKQLKEKHKKDMAIVQKIKSLTKSPVKSEAEKVEKDKKLEKYFDQLLGSEQ